MKEYVLLLPVKGSKGVFDIADKDIYTFGIIWRGYSAGFLVLVKN